MSQTFTSRITAPNLADIFVVAYLLRKNLAPREYPVLTLVGAIKMKEHIMKGIILINFIFSPRGSIYKKLIVWLKYIFLYIGHTFRINWYHMKLDTHFIQNFVSLQPWMSQFKLNIFFCLDINFFRNRFTWGKNKNWRSNSLHFHGANIVRGLFSGGAIFFSNIINPNWKTLPNLTFLSAM